MASRGLCRSPIGGYTKRRGPCAAIGWWRGKGGAQAPAAPRGDLGREEREPGKPRVPEKRERKKKKTHTHRPKKTEVSLLISRQPRYAGRARGFQRERLAWTFGEGCLESPPSPRESPQPFPGSAQGMAVQAPRTCVCSPILPWMATFCGWGDPAHLPRPQTLSNRTSRVNAIPAL